MLKKINKCFQIKLVFDFNFIVYYTTYESLKTDEI